MLARNSHRAFVFLANALALFLLTFADGLLKAKLVGEADESTFDRLAKGLL